MNKPIIIIGAGSYVFDDDFAEGVVLRAIKQWIELYNDNDIVIFYHSKEKINQISLKINSLGYKNVFLKYLDRLDIFLNSNDIFSSFIVVPDHAHFEYAKKMLEHKIPTWIVKPVTDDLSKASKLLELSQCNKTILWVDYHKRFDVSNRILKDFVKDGRYGDMLHYSVQYTQPIALPLDTFSWAKNTNVFSYIGCHYIDQIEFLYEKKIKSFKILSIGTKGMLFDKISCFDTILVTMVVKTNDQKEIVCTFQVGWSDPAGTSTKSHQRVEITFENARMIMDQKNRGMELWDNKKTRQLNPYFFSKSYDTFFGKELYSGYGYDSIKYFLDCIKEKTIKKSNTLPYIQNVLFSEKVLKAVKKSLQYNSIWIEENM